MTRLRDSELEGVLEKVGTGCFQWLVLLTCGLANAADAVEILSVSLISTAAQEDLQLTPQRAGVLNGCIFLGMLLGGLLWGALGDVLGRKYALLLALLANATFGSLSAGSQTLSQMLLLRLLAGLGVGGSVPLVFSTMGEFCTIKTRGKFMALCASFWMVGSLYSSSVGWIVIPRAGWRLFVVLASLPAWAAALMAWLWLPESPRFLLVSGKHEEALKVLQRVAITNGQRLPDDVTLHPVVDRSYNRVHDSWSSYLSHKWKAVQASLSSILLEQPLRSSTWPLMVGWIGLCGGWYCTVLWIPRYFEERGATGSSIYAETFAVSLGNLPGNLASLYLVDVLGRRLTACASMALACVAALLFGVAPANGIWPIVAACVFNGISVAGWNSLDLISAELYPTSVRSTGFGLLSSVGRLSSFITTYAAGALLEVALWAPLLVAAILLAAGSTAMMMLPEPAGKPLEDVVEHLVERCDEEEDMENTLLLSLDDGTEGIALSSRANTLSSDSGK